MKSGKQRKHEIKAARAARAARAAKLSRPGQAVDPVPSAMVRCNPDNLAPYNSYGTPRFVERGYYQDVSFSCQDCGVDEVWRGTQQKWWYEVAKGSVESTANRCRACRRIERERKAAARKDSLAGIERKQAARD